MAAPSGGNKTLSVPTHYKLRVSDFGFADTDGDAFAAVRFTSLATSGTLYYDPNGANGGQRVAITAGQTISVQDILAGKVTFVSSGTTGSSFTFQVQDSSGSDNLDFSPNTLSFTPVASAPVNTLFGPSISLAGLAVGNGFKIQGEAPAAGGSATQAGSVANAGDVNGDGFADVIVGAFGFSNGYGSEFTGAAYVVFGKASGFSQVNLDSLTASDGFKIIGENAYDQAGGRVASAGDFNGDGFGDVIISASGNPGGTGNGAAYVVFGKSTGFGTIDLANLGTAGFKIVGEAVSDFVRSGAVASGDFNGDGLTDVLLGAAFADAPGGNSGAAYVVFGKESGFGTVNLGSLGGDGFKISGEGVGDYLGRSVSSAGDVNGDGFEDILVGGYSNNSTGRTDNGAAYVIFGKAAGLSSITVSALDGTNGFKVVGALGGEYAGWSVSSAGDINGDGFADIVIGTDDQYAATSHNGAAYVVFGKASGFGATIDLNGLSAGTGFKITGAVTGDYAGYAVAGAGDVNADGYADILVSADRNDAGASNAGTVYLLFGKATGFGPVDLGTLSATDGVKIVGEAAGDQIGRTVSAAGDVNGDGYADLLVGSFGNDSGGTNAGSAYVIFGRSNVANTAPVANPDALAATEDTPITFTVAQLTGNDTDAENSPLTITSVTSGVGGTAVLNGNGTVTFTPTANFNGAASFTYTVSDGSLTSNSATVTVNVAAVNDAPVANADTLAATEDTAVVFTAAQLLGNDADVEDNPLTIASVAGGVGGTAVLNGDGTVTFTPSANFNGPASFTYTVSDGSLTSASATVTVNVAAVNDAPFANDDTLAATEDAVVTFTAAQLIGNDTDVDGNPLTIASVTSGTGGTAILNGNGTVTFSPAANFNGAASFAYTVSDGNLTSNSATVTVNVAAVNDAPIANADTLAATEDTAIVFTAAQLIGNDTDAEGSPLTIASVTSGVGGTPVLNGDGTVTFTPAVNFNGAATFTYAVSDGSLTSNSATVTVNVAAVNDAPVANNDTLAAIEDTAVVLSAAQLTGNDTDVEGSVLTIASVTSGVGGTAVLNGDGTVTFTPTVNFNGAASFTYTVSDGGLSSNNASVAINVSSVNDAPAGIDGAVTGTEDLSYTFSLADFGFSDVDGNAVLAVRITTLPSTGTLRNNGTLVSAGDSVTAAAISSGQLTFTPIVDQFGSPYASFTFQVQDNGGTVNGGVDLDPTPNILTINILSDNVAPTVDLNGLAAGRDFVTSYTEDARFPVAIGTNVIVADFEAEDLIESASIRLMSAGAGDALTIQGTLPAGITAAVATVGADIVITLTGAGTPAAYATAIGQIRFSTTSQDPAAAGPTRTISVTVNDGEANSAVANAVITVVPVDDPSVARPDFFSTVDNGLLTGNVRSNNGSGADSDPDGPVETVTRVNGAAVVGTVVTLASGAQVRVNADGTFTYEAGTAFASLAAPGSGANNTQATETFTYTLAGGSTATVTIQITGVDNADRLLGTTGADTLNGGVMDDVLIGGLGADTLIGGSGTDTVSYEDNYGAISVDLRIGMGYTNAAFGDRYNSIENVRGSIFDDYIIGGYDNNVLEGGAGNDVLIGSLGADTLNGGDGIDFASYEDNQGAVFVYLPGNAGYGNAAQGDTYVSIENLRGSMFDDYLFGDAGTNRLEGIAGNDVLIGGLGADVLVGGDGSDTASYEENWGMVSVDLMNGRGYGNAAQGDTYQSIENARGGLFDDTLIGDHSANRLMGGLGNDTLVGNLGADTFVFDIALSATTNVDLILDFATGADKIELSRSVFGAIAAGGLTSSAFATGTAATTADQRIVYDQATGNLFYDADGSGAGAAALFATLTTKPVIAATDFVVV